MSCCSSPDDEDGKMEIKNNGGRVVTPMKMDVRWNNKEFIMKSDPVDFDKFKGTISINTACIIADSKIEKTPDVAPPLHVSTTFEHDNLDGLGYSRVDSMTRRRLERLLGELEGGYSIVYSSGLAAVTAIMHALKPKKVAIEGGYFQTHSNLRELQLEIVNFDAKLEKGDVYILESPSNPYCICRDIKEFSDKAHAIGAFVVVDGTFAPPTIQKALELGADYVLHSATKYIGGHSDVLAGVVSVKSFDRIRGLHSQRQLLGSILGNMESWLLLRSIRTLPLRVKRQTKSAAKIALWLSTQKVVTKVWHPIIPSHPSFELCKKQMKAPPACFSFELSSPEEASSLPKKLRLFVHATSLGGVESLIDYRYAYDHSVSPCLLRVSVGLESAKDLINDLANAFYAN